MSVELSLRLNKNIAAAPIYVGGASIEQIQKEYGVGDIIKLASNESPFGPSPKAVEAMQSAATGLNRYPPMGDEDLRAALVQSIGQGIEPDNFVTGNGGCDILNMLATAFMNPGDECIICRPTFPVYDITARRIGANVVYVDLDPEHFTYDIEAILGAITEQTRLVYVCSPNNPTGTTMSAEQMDALVNTLPPHVLLVTDEVYFHFATTTDFPNSLAYIREGKNVVILHSFSKAFGLAGLRLGYGIAPVEIAQYLSRARLPFHLDNVTVTGGIAGLSDTEYIQKTVEAVVTGRDYLHGQLTDMQIPVWASQANFVLFKPPFVAADVSERLLRRGVIVRPMTQFYLPIHLRATVGLPEENERFITALKESLAELGAEGAAQEKDTEDAGGEFKF